MQAGQAVFAASTEPLTDGPFAHPEGFGDGPLFPALLIQSPGAQATDLAPILGGRIG